MRTGARSCYCCCCVLDQKCGLCRVLSYVRSVGDIQGVKCPLFAVIRRSAAPNPQAIVQINDIVTTPGARSNASLPAMMLLYSTASCVQPPVDVSVRSSDCRDRCVTADRVLHTELPVHFPADRPGCGASAPFVSVTRQPDQAARSGFLPKQGTGLPPFYLV